MSDGPPLYVLTAGPHAGKTTTCRFLQALGFHVVPESARLLFDEYIGRGVDPEVVRDHPTFRHHVEAIDQWLEATVMQTNAHQPIVLDRSLADNMAFRRMDEDYETGAILEPLCRDRYEGVFALELLPFESDYARDEDEKEAVEQHQTLITVYEDPGYTPELVEVKEPSQRTRQIVESIQKS